VFVPYKDDHNYVSTIGEQVEKVFGTDFRILKASNVDNFRGLILKQKLGVHVMRWINWILIDMDLLLRVMITGIKGLEIREPKVLEASTSLSLGYRRTGFHLDLGYRKHEIELLAVI
jgi:hypothetical protein